MIMCVCVWVRAFTLKPRIGLHHGAARAPQALVEATTAPLHPDAVTQRDLMDFADALRRELNSNIAQQRQALVAISSL